MCERQECRPATMKITSVVLLAHFSKTVSLLNALPTQCAANASNSEKPNTGKVVPIPYSEGIRNREPCFMAIENMLPKNRPAETGQKERAKTIPSRPAPHALDFCA